MTWFDLGKSILSASITAGLVSFLASQWTQLRQVRLAHIREQLEKFYGPVVFLIRTNTTILQQNNTLRQYGEDNLGGPNAKINWQDEEQVKRNSAEIDLNIALQNKYSGVIKQNNLEMVGVIRGNYHLIDAEDQAVCQRLVLNVIRLGIEDDQTARLHEYKRQNPVYIIDPRVIGTIEQSYRRKQKELVKLSSWPWPFNGSRKQLLKQIEEQKTPTPIG